MRRRMIFLNWICVFFVITITRIDLIFANSVKNFVIPKLSPIWEHINLVVRLQTYVYMVRTKRIVLVVWGGRNRVVDDIHSWRFVQCLSLAVLSVCWIRVLSLINSLNANAVLRANSQILIIGIRLDLVR